MAKINFTDSSMKNKRCKKNINWEIKESGESGHIIKAKSGLSALKKYKKRYGEVTSKIVNISGEC